MIKNALLALLLVAVVVGSYGVVYSAGKDDGRTAERAEWLGKVTEAQEIRAKAAQEKAKAVEEAVKDGDQRVAAARAVADTADNASVGLRKQVDALAGRLASSQERLSSEIVARSKAEAEGAALLAQLLGISDEAAGKYARTADEAIERGTTCERSYDAVTGPR